MSGGMLILVVTAIVAMATIVDAITKAIVVRAEVRKIISEHIEVLRIQVERGFSRDPYGKLIDSGWIKNLKYFYGEHIPPRYRTFVGIKTVNNMIFYEIERIPTDPVREGLQKSIRAITPGNGTEYEYVIKDYLVQLGWSVRHTGRSGDQGADLLATIDGFSAVVQCKYYTGKVGNKAVQEVAAARKYYGTDGAIVVSNAMYTTPAKKLAQANDVRLYTHGELNIFSKESAALAGKLNQPGRACQLLCTRGEG